MKLDDELNKLKDDIPNMNSNLDDLILDKHQKKKNLKNNMSLRKIILILSPVFILFLLFTSLLIFVPKGLNSGITYPTETTPPTSTTTKYLSNIIRKQAKKEEAINYDSEGYKAFCNKLQNFSIKLSEIYYQNNLNSTFALSPISIINVLGLAIECTNNSTRNEILNALDVTYEEVLTYYPILQKNINIEKYKKDYLNINRKTCQYFSNNAIWYADDINAKDNTLDNLANNYYADIFNIDFVNHNDAASKDIRKYINETTNNLLDPKISLSDDTKLFLLNTIYLEDIWSSNMSLSNQKTQFTNYNNNVINTEFYISKYSSAKIGKTSKMSYYYLKTNEGFMVYFMVPNDGYIVNDIYNYDSIRTVLDDKYNGYDSINDVLYFSNITFPAFNAEMQGSLKKELNYLGINSIFSYNADFSNFTDTNLYANDIIHGTKLSVNKDGIKGAAFTYMEGCTSVDPSKIIYETLEVDKAFAYVVVDSDNNITFTGVVNEL